MQNSIFQFEFVSQDCLKNEILCKNLSKCFLLFLINFVCPNFLQLSIMIFLVFPLGSQAKFICLD